MSSFSCGITGEVCKEPTVTPSGGVFERKVIERWISENGTDPETKQALSKGELVQVSINKKVRGHLSSFSDETITKGHTGNTFISFNKCYYKNFDVSPNLID